MVNQHLMDNHFVERIVGRIFPLASTRVERVVEGVSTWVYRISYRNETFYLRILPEEDASFAPEVAVHTQLRHMQAKVPEVIYFEHYNELLQRSLMVTTEIKGRPISQSPSLGEHELQTILMDAGRDLARINSIAVAGFGWVKRDLADTEHLRAELPTHRAFVFEHWEADLDYLARNVLTASEITRLEQVLSHYHFWLDIEQGQLAHGDFDTTHIYQDHGQYMGIIDFGEIRGASLWYDLGHFHMRDGEQIPSQLLPPLVSGYREVITLPSANEQCIRFTSMLINVRTLARVLQKRPPNRYTQHQLEVLRGDLATLL